MFVSSVFDLLYSVAVRRDDLKHHVRIGETNVVLNCIVTWSHTNKWFPSIDNAQSNAQWATRSRCKQTGVHTDRALERVQMQMPKHTQNKFCPVRLGGTIFLAEHLCSQSGRPHQITGCGVVAYQGLGVDSMQHLRSVLYPSSLGKCISRHHHHDKRVR